MKPHKKSETLEIRLSHPDKQALRDKAAREGRSVSDVVRGLISEYIADDARSPSPLTELVMTLKRKPKTLAATLLAALALPFAYAPFAAAKDVALQLNGEYVVPEGDGTRTRSFETEVHMGVGESMILDFSSNTSTFVLNIELTREGDLVVLKFDLDDGQTVLATPTLKAAFDEATQMQMVVAEETVFKLSATPSEL